MNVFFFSCTFSLFACSLSVEFWPQQADFIVVGAGTAGSAVSSRLSENGKYEVLVLEAGGTAHFVNDIPLFVPGPFSGQLDWDFKTEAQKHCFQAHINETWPWPQGKGLGGSTLINAMVYTRGNSRDYDRWKALGNKGWGYKDVLPFFKKLEAYEGFVNEDNKAYHGFDGPVPSARPTYETELIDVLLEAGKEIGYAEVDYNAGSQKGFSKPFFIIRNGSRFAADKAYLKNSRPNLHIVTKAFVQKIEFDREKRAVGVIFEFEGKKWYANARKEVILSAGATKSPQILMLSGIGPKETLEKFQIPEVKHLAGVGQNLRDHIATFSTTFNLNKELGFSLPKLMNAESFEQWETKHQGPLTVPIPVEVMAFVDSEYADKSIDWPDLEFIFPQKKISWMYKDGYEFQTVPSSGESMIFPSAILLRPKSVGYITIRSKDPYDSPVIQPNYCSDKRDVDTLVSGVKTFIKMTKTKAMMKYKAVWKHKKPIKGCEKEKFMSDEYLACYVRHYTVTFFHPSGTCKMGKKDDEMAVVDSKLRVYGVRSLRVVDISISPEIISGHTMIPSFMIGEKAADMILNDWKTKDEL